MELDIENTRVTILLNDNNNKVYAVAMTKERLEAITTAIKMAIEYAVPTGKTQGELVKFLEMEMKK
ncbi:hypothetical protein HMI01_14950 [Halolactibacillus miurensis]|uniref:Uncharacterized protein n=1 Tax=Halolactibacillus miurensis TaxID=306541 RepID=A0A1I6S178_9BACI|nr:hypothetical protein HMI01_14950 [Halolactibacillus miurensis]SFS70488.1 hypothetical protein SAMN05421668_10768 [Halolactibacillus miurensis]